MAVDTSARLLRLIALLHERRFWTGAELAEELGITPRSVRRDIDRVRSLGYPVHAAPGVGGGYSLGAGRDLAPLPLDDEEAMAVAVGLRAAVSGPVAGMEDAALRALTKLEAVLPRRLRRRVEALGRVSVQVPGGRRGVDAEVLSALAAASREEERVAFDYTSLRGVATRRDVEPYRLVHTSTRWYLLAWDRTRGDWRTFRVDRVTSGTVARGVHFVPRPLPDEPAAFVARSVTSAPYRVQARVLVHASVEVVRGRYKALGYWVEPVDEGRCELTVGGDDAEHLAVSLGYLGLDLEVIEPPELAEAFERLGERFLRAGGGAGRSGGESGGRQTPEVGPRGPSSGS